MLESQRMCYRCYDVYSEKSMHKITIEDNKTIITYKYLCGVCTSNVQAYLNSSEMVITIPEEKER